MIKEVKRDLFAAAGQISRCSVEESLVIAGVPRAGTTWMLELLRTLPGRKALNEPLLYETARFDYEFGWHKYIDPDDAALRQREFLEQVLTGQLKAIRPWFFEADSQPAKLFEHASRRKLIVKFCRLNRALHWFTRQFDVHGLVFMVRHPCSVVASMMRQGSWDEAHLSNHGRSRVKQALHGGALPPSLEDVFRPILERISTRIEVLAVHWCLDHYVPLIHHARDRRYPWLLVPYERLVVEGQSELERITNGLGVEMTSSMQDQLREPSTSVVDRLHREPRQQLSKWKRRLSGEQVERILSIVEEAGLSRYYTDAVEPDYDELNSCQRAEFRW